MMISSFKCDVTYFPFDNQNILFHFGSWSHGEKQLKIVKDGSPMLAKNYLKVYDVQLSKFSIIILVASYKYFSSPTSNLCMIRLKASCNFRLKTT